MYTLGLEDRKWCILKWPNTTPIDSSLVLLPCCDAKERRCEITLLGRKFETIRAETDPAMNSVSFYHDMSLHLNDLLLFLSIKRETDYYLFLFLCHIPHSYSWTLMSAHMKIKLKWYLLNWHSRGIYFPQLTLLDSSVWSAFSINLLLWNIVLNLITLLD